MSIVSRYMYKAAEHGLSKANSVTCTRFGHMDTGLTVQCTLYGTDVESLQRRCRLNLKRLLELERRSKIKRRDSRGWTTNYRQDRRREFTWIYACVSAHTIRTIPIDAENHRLVQED